MGFSKHAQLTGVLAAAALLASVLLLSNGNGGRVELVSAKTKPAQASFSKVWGDWLHKVEVQVKAAVDLSSGLGPAKEAKLTHLLNDDMKKDFSKEKRLSSSFDPTASKTSKHAQTRHAIHARAAKAGKAEASSAPQAASQTHKAQAAKAIRAAVQAVAVKPKRLGVAKVHDAQINRPVRKAGKLEVTPYGKALNNDVSRDDAKIAAAESKAAAAEHVLLREEGVKSADQARARAAMQGAKKVLKARSSQPSTTKAAKKAAAKPFHKAMSAAQELAKEAAKSKELKMMQGALIAELQGTEKGPASAEEKREVEEEEAAIGNDLSNWGISNLHAKDVKKHPGEVMQETRHEEKSWLSDLSKWGISH